jgi:hypothetical protein
MTSLVWLDALLSKLPQTKKKIHCPSITLPPPFGYLLTDYDHVLLVALISTAFRLIYTHDFFSFPTSSSRAPDLNTHVFDLLPLLEWRGTPNLSRLQTILTLWLAKRFARSDSSHDLSLKPRLSSRRHSAGKRR